jgi:hypothetical protein
MPAKRGARARACAFARVTDGAAVTLSPYSNVKQSGGEEMA